MNYGAEWKANDRVWFIAEPGATPVLVKITKATDDGWHFRSWDGGIEDFEPVFGERLQDRPRRRITQKIAAYSWEPWETKASRG